MSPAATASPDPSAAARSQRQHDLLSPLTIISGRAQLLARLVRRSSSLTERERDALLEGLTIILEAVQVQAARIDSFGHEDRDARVHDGMAIPPREGARQ